MDDRKFPLGHWKTWNSRRNHTKNFPPVSHRAKALRGPEPTFKVKDYSYRVSFVLRQGTWWVVERAPRPQASHFLQVLARKYQLVAIQNTISGLL